MESHLQYHYHDRHYVVKIPYSSRFATNTFLLIALSTGREWSITEGDAEPSGASAHEWAHRRGLKEWFKCHGSPEGSWAGRAAPGSPAGCPTHPSACRFQSRPERGKSSLGPGEAESAAHCRGKALLQNIASGEFRSGSWSRDLASIELKCYNYK